MTTDWSDVSKFEFREVRFLNERRKCVSVKLSPKVHYRKRFSKLPKRPKNSSVLVLPNPVYNKWQEWVFDKFSRKEEFLRENNLKDILTKDEERVAKFEVLTLDIDYPFNRLYKRDKSGKSLLEFFEEIFEDSMEIFETASGRIRIYVHVEPDEWMDVNFKLMSFDYEPKYIFFLLCKNLLHYLNQKIKKRYKIEMDKSFLTNLNHPVFLEEFPIPLKNGKKSRLYKSHKGKIKLSKLLNKFPPFHNLIISFYKKNINLLNSLLSIDYSLKDIISGKLYKKLKKHSFQDWKLFPKKEDDKTNTKYNRKRNRIGEYEIIYRNILTELKNNEDDWWSYVSKPADKELQTNYRLSFLFGELEKVYGKRIAKALFYGVVIPKLFTFLSSTSKYKLTYSSKQPRNEKRWNRVIRPIVKTLILVAGISNPIIVGALLARYTYDVLPKENLDDEVAFVLDEVERMSDEEKLEYLMNNKHFAKILQPDKKTYFFDFLKLLSIYERTDRREFTFEELRNSLDLSKSCFSKFIVYLCKMEEIGFLQFEIKRNGKYKTIYFSKLPSPETVIYFDWTGAKARTFCGLKYNAFRRLEALENPDEKLLADKIKEFDLKIDRVATNITAFVVKKLQKEKKISIGTTQQFWLKQGLTRIILKARKTKRLGATSLAFILEHLSSFLEVVVGFLGLRLFKKTSGRIEKGCGFEGTNFLTFSRSPP